MKEIPLTQGKVALVDDDDYEYLNQFKWCAKKDKKSFYAYRYLNYMHRVIMNPPKGMFVDHIDGNGLNNQKSNLRLCTNLENSRNKKPSNKNGYKGVKASGLRWIARIRVNDKTKHLGTFDTKEEAALAYDQKAKEVFGDFSNPNFR